VQGTSKLPTRRTSTKEVPTPSQGTRRSRSMSKGGPRASSNMRTPLSVRSLSVNRSTGKSKDTMTPKRFQSTAKKSSNLGLESSARRISTMGPARGWKETRPLTEKAYQTKQIRRLLDFLRENRFGNESMTSKHFPLSSKDFVEVFNFLYSFLNPHKQDVLPKTKFEEKVIQVLKTELNYPGTLSRTHMVTMGTLHSWPHILGAILYIFEIVIRRTSYEDNAVVIAFPSTDDKGFSIDRENKNKIYLEHGFEAYRMFMNGEEETETLDNNYRDRLLEYYEVNTSMLASLQDRRNKERQEVEELMQIKNTAEKVDAMVQQKAQSVKDLETRLKRAATGKMKFDDMVEKIQVINHQNKEVLGDLVQNAQFSLPSTETALEQMAEDLVTYVQDLSQQLEVAKKNKADAEAEAYHRAHEIQTVVRRINRYCAKQEWNISIPVPEVRKGVLTASADLGHIMDRFKHHMESYRRELTDLQNKIEERRGNLEKLRVKQESMQSTINMLKQKDKEIKDHIQVEEASLHAKVKDAKEQLILRSNMNQRAKQDLMKEVEELREELENKIKEKAEIQKDVTIYQEQAVNMLKRTISEVLHVRDEAKKAVERRNERHLKQTQDALLELEKLKEDVNKY